MTSRPFISCWAILLALCAVLSVSGGPSIAQVRSIDPDTAIDGDLMGPPTATPAPDTAPGPWIDISPEPSAGNGTPADLSPSSVDNWNATDIGAGANQAAPESKTYHKDDLIGAAEGVFGKGSEGLASMIEDLLAKQGEPNAYIVGREGGGAIGLGLRYGSGTLYHKVEGNRPAYWTGPSLGFDVGLNAGKAFVLVYNLYDAQDLFHRFGAGEGQAYLVGGFHISYLRRGDVVLIPVRMGAGLRLGANVGYMKFSEKQRWMPF